MGFECVSPVLVGESGATVLLVLIRTNGLVEDRLSYCTEPGTWPKSHGSLYGPGSARIHAI